MKARNGGGTWRNDRGKTMHPLVSFEALVGGRGPEEADDWNDLVPLGELNEREVATLSNLLAGFTRTTDRCWFALWDGYGVRYWLEPMPGDRSAVLSPTSAARQHGREELLRGVPRVRTLWSRSDPPAASREYLLFVGPLQALAGFSLDTWWQPPNMWWPDDRAWFVATEVDGYDTFVGGSRHVSRPSSTPRVLSLSRSHKTPSSVWSTR